MYCKVRFPSSDESRWGICAFHSNHKIHELQERAVPSPASHTMGGDRPPKGSASKKGIPRGGTPQEPSPKGVPLAGCPQPPPGSAHAPIGAQNPVEGGGSSRSPPPQRHLHTHHHTHVGVGVGYPLYDPYGGAFPLFCMVTRVLQHKATHIFLERFLGFYGERA